MTTEHPPFESIYFLLNMGIFQPVILVFRGIYLRRTPSQRGVSLASSFGVRIHREAATNAPWDCQVDVPWTKKITAGLHLDVFVRFINTWIFFKKIGRSTHKYNWRIRNTWNIMKFKGSQVVVGMCYQKNGPCPLFYDTVATFQKRPRQRWCDARCK